MYGMGILKGLGVTFKHFIRTYIDDIKYAGRKYLRQENFEARQGLKADGAFTVMYPEEKIAVPERFRFIPFLVVEDPDHPERPGEDWCTSCGICAKVCPPQCIWIVRGEDPVTKRPVPQPEAFFIDIDICMNCGYCAEFCPFDAIKMDHNYELSYYPHQEPHARLVHDKAELTKPDTYHASIHPSDWHRELEDRAAEEAKKKAAAEAKAKADAAKAAGGGPSATAPKPAAAAKPAPPKAEDKPGEAANQ